MGMTSQKLKHMNLCEHSITHEHSLKCLHELVLIVPQVIIELNMQNGWKRNSRMASVGGACNKQRRKRTMFQVQLLTC